jgi:hypothetical protein
LACTGFTLSISSDLPLVSCNGNPVLRYVAV